MESSNKLHIDFGIPEHGWLPTIFQYQDYKLELEISDVPVDPMAQLCEALIEINEGIREPRPIIWHLEPYCYYLQLRKMGSGYKAVISESDDLESPTKVVTEITGSFEEIVLPFYSALKKFWSKSFKPPHWEELDQNRVEEITQLIEEKKRA